MTEPPGAAGAVDDVVVALGWPPPRHVAPITGGITNRNWLVDTGTGRYVVRRYGEHTDALGIDRDDECRAAGIAATVGVGPPVVAALPQLGCLVTELVDGHEPDRADLARSPLLDRTVDALRRFHAGGRVRQRFDPFSIATGYAAIARDHGVVVPAAAERLATFASGVQHALAAAAPSDVLCHNDLLPANLIVAGDRVVLLDYEYAGMGDPFFDLGNLSVNGGFDDEADDRLLGCYFGATTRAAWARVKLMRIVSELREGMWGVVQQGVSALDVDFAAYAAEHLERGEALAADRRVDGWLTDARRPVGP